MNPKTTSAFTSDPPVFLLKDLTVRVLEESEHARADYFRKHGRPKKLWIKSLDRNALPILTGMDVPKQFQSALNRNSPERDLAL